MSGWYHACDAADEGHVAVVLLGMLGAGYGGGSTGQPFCAGTGIGYPGAAANVDLGDPPGNPSTISVSLSVGQLLFVGANDCAHYQLTPAAELGPVLQQVPSSPAPHGTQSFAALYEAASTGTVVIQIECSPSYFCDRKTMSIDVSVG